MATAAATQTPDIENDTRQVRAMIRYVDPGDFITRRYVSQGAELNTGTYSDHEVTVRDGMPIRDHFELDVHGFMIGKNPTAVRNFHDKAEVERLYEQEVVADFRRRVGADKVVARGWMIRTSADLSERARQKTENYQHVGGIQPPAGEAHIDFDTPTAEQMARETYKEQFPDGPGFSRFMIISYWRCFSPPLQDVPLAMCDGRTSFLGEEKSNKLFVVDQIPEGDALMAPVDENEPRLAATILSHHPGHRWWYFANMNVDDVLLIKFHDSDHSTTWRCPHTAFFDPTFPDARVRESIEVRALAFWE